MGDKNRTVRVEGVSTQAKTGHGILKAIYMPTPGDRIWEIIDGTADCDATLFSIDGVSITQPPLSLPYINRPVNTGLRIQVVSGATGEILVVFE